MGRRRGGMGSYRPLEGNRGGEKLNNYSWLAGMVRKEEEEKEQIRGGMCK